MCTEIVYGCNVVSSKKLKIKKLNKKLNGQKYEYVNCVWCNRENMFRPIHQQFHLNRARDEVRKIAWKRSSPSQLYGKVQSRAVRIAFTTPKGLQE